MTTSQNPYGPQAQPAQPYAPLSHNGFTAGPQTGPQRVGRHSAPAAPAAPAQAVWASGPQQHRAPVGFAPQSRVDGPGHARAPRTGAPADPRNAYAGHVPSTTGYAPQNSGNAAQNHGYAPQNAGHAPRGTGFADPRTGFAPQDTARPRPQTVADRVAQVSGAPSVPAQRSGENPLPVYPTGGGQVLSQARPPRNGLGTAALVLGILAALFAMIPIIGMIAWPLSILGLVFGVIGIARTRSGKADNKGVAISGTVLSAIGLILCIVWVAAVGSAVSSAPTTGTVPASSGAAPAATGQAAGAYPGATSNDVVGNAGDTLTVGDMQISATALKPGDSTLGKTLCSTVTYKNTGSTPAQFSGPGDWKLQDPSGAALMTGFTGSTSILSTGELAPGGTTTGDMCFDRNASASSGQYVLLYQPMMSFSSTRGAWLNQVG